MKNKSVGYQMWKKKNTEITWDGRCFNKNMNVEIGYYQHILVGIGKRKKKGEKWAGGNSRPRTALVSGYKL
jgi:hypothetical protein